MLCRPLYDSMCSGGGDWTACSPRPRPFHLNHIFQLNLTAAYSLTVDL